MTDATLEHRLLSFVATQRQGVLVTLKADGRPQLSNVLYAWDPDTRTARVSVTADRAKTRNLQRDPRASLHVTSPDFWTWAVLESTAELTPVAADPHDDTVDQLVALYRSLSGEHPDWDAYRASMVTDRRLVVRLTAGHVYGQVASG
ncbi:TIGR03618 family F420-dependent PPOX class oxidoreductase [Modestobacter sp. I12A-02628]|uniref:PPOX class F420-dependent oxidoreductase n=1 Tax=Goekera deserti TaxID=2497753 RepID=A0A7K3WEN0_9ACTN|nr:PPOX class F420-dependent oxidoreductase [Goekera deserti]MPQ98019.1 TIGR03618 family F420-dependent PPOX class oxidoreductase [Goekera deserti]NDI48666.1 TIGR03618 family F420-dependent PPOX class oxidoreductase [Goekera deserti]NEL54955.1 PPOX class F420-dependent oxidoreductase [Goekera deserti]